MSTKPRTNPLADVTRSFNDAVRKVEQEQQREPVAYTERTLREKAAAHELPAARRIPTPAASALVLPKIRSLIQEEARLHWHHRELPVSRFSACMLMPG